MTRPLSLLAFVVALTLAAEASADEKRKPPPLDTKVIGQPLLDAHNRARAEEDLPPLTLVPALTAAAQAHADDMAEHQKMSHEGSDGSSPFDRIKRAGYRYKSSGENVAEGQRSVAAVMKAWMNSPHHRENILGKFSEAGMAVATDDEGYPYWCVTFGTPWPKLDPTRAGGDLIGAINSRRQAAGKKPLAANDKLNEVATDVARSFANEHSSEVDLDRRLKEVGYRFRTVAFSGASGQAEAAEVVGQWLKNDHSKANLLGDYSEAGAGYATARSGAPSWCLILAQPRTR